MRPWYTTRKRTNDFRVSFVLDFASVEMRVWKEQRDRKHIVGPSSSPLIARNLFNLYIFRGRLYTVGCEGTRKYIRRWVQLHVVLVYMCLLWNLECRPEAGCVSSTILSLPLACAHAGQSIISDPLSVWWSERCRALGPSYSIKYIHSTVVISQQPHMPPYMCEWNQPTFNIIYISTKITTNRFFMCPIN